jgi:hypothetical protein
MIGRVEETSASFEARYAPRSYPTVSDLGFRDLLLRKIMTEETPGALPLGNFDLVAR